MPILLILVLGVAVFILYPLAIIWGLNTLFALGIAYTFKTWLATLIVTAAVSGEGVKVNYKKN